MEFRLIYPGPLLASQRDETRQARRIHAHEIRRKLHSQLEEQWRVQPALNWLKTASIQDKGAPHRARVDELADKYIRRGIHFAPLVSEDYGMACGLDILFLRRGERGKVIQTGDLDNRIKTFFDALSVPQENQIPDDLDPGQEPNPFYCLLADDSLITHFRITADRLLLSEQEALTALVRTDSKDQGAQSPESMVCLIISVRTVNTDRLKSLAECDL